MTLSLAYFYDNLVPVFTFAGLVVFDLSGGLRAIQAEMDGFGVATVGLVTALGGGTLRDVLIGQLPVGWIIDPWPLGIVIPSAFLAYGIHRLGVAERAIFNWVDAVGMATFCVAGAALSLEAGIHPLMAILMGVFTATFGGLLRDILCNVVPFVLRQEIYATAALLGAGLYVGLLQLGLDPALSALAGMVTALLLRGIAIFFKLNIREEDKHTSHLTKQK